jgi:hypothetical protein
MPVDDDLFELETKLPRGTQIVYVASHIPLETWEQEVNHKLVEPGFVTSGPTEHGEYFCRYWLFDYRNDEYIPELRTKANSELTPGDRLVVTETFNQLHVTREIRTIDDE